MDEPYPINFFPLLSFHETQWLPPLDEQRVAQVNHRRDDDVTILPGHLGHQAEVQQASVHGQPVDRHLGIDRFFGVHTIRAGKPRENHNTFSLTSTNVMDLT